MNWFGLLHKMTFTEKQIDLLRAALIAGREYYCRDQAEHGGDGMEAPEDDIKAAMELMGMQWPGDLSQIFHGDAWTGNEQLKPKADE